MRYRRRRLALALGAGAVATALATLGLASAATETSVLSPEQAAVDRFCAEQDPCIIINGLADPSADGSKPLLMTTGQALALNGRSPGACPEARDAYRQTGVDPDAFVGPCPGPKRLPQASMEEVSP